MKFKAVILVLILICFSKVSFGTEIQGKSFPTILSSENVRWIEQVEAELGQASNNIESLKQFTSEAKNLNKALKSKNVEASNFVRTELVRISRKTLGLQNRIAGLVEEIQFEGISNIDSLTLRRLNTLNTRFEYYRSRFKAYILQARNMF